MSWAVMISNSPVFSPSSSRVSSSLFCKPSETHSPSSLTSSPSSSALKLRLPKPRRGLIRASNDVVSSSSTSPSTLLKRKRPAKLDIPIAPLSFGGALATPSAAEERRKEVVDDGDGYAVYCKRGRRDAMEDRYSAKINLQGDSKQGFFGVFDGHGGAKAAQFAADNLAKNVGEEMKKRGDEDIEEAIKHAYLRTDSEFLSEDLRGGSCCVTALIRNGILVVSNAGDCRAVISRGGTAEALTSDHRPSREDEKDRVESLGGFVDICHGVWRLQGSLAVSRGIGDRHLKQWVTAEPETKIMRIEPGSEFLILASDGLWDKISNQEAVDIGRPFCIGIDKLEPLTACKKLAELSVSRGSADDISVMIIRLGHFC